MAYVPSQHINTEEKWVIELDTYQRNNLLWLLQACWSLNIEPFNLAFTGDWIGEIAYLLARPGEQPELSKDDRSNTTHDDLRIYVESWLRNKIKEANDASQ